MVRLEVGAARENMFQRLDEIITQAGGGEIVENGVPDAVIVGPGVGAHPDGGLHPLPWLEAAGYLVVCHRIKIKDKERQ